MLQQKLPPLSLIVRNEVPTPNADKPYPQNLIDLKGLKIGISGRGASTDTATRFMLKQAGLDPDKDVTIMPVGDPGTMLASLKNRVIDAAMAVEPTQTAAVLSLKIAKTVADIEGGGGPACFILTPITACSCTPLSSKTIRIRRARIVAAIVEACAVINDPARMNDLMDVAANYMKGSDPDGRQSLSGRNTARTTARSRPARASKTSAPCCLPPRSIEKAVPYEQIVATDFMPPEAGAPTR